MVIDEAGGENSRDERSRLRILALRGQDARQNRLRAPLGGTGASGSAKDLLRARGSAGVVVGLTKNVIEGRIANQPLYLLNDRDLLLIQACREN